MIFVITNNAATDNNDVNVSFIISIFPRKNRFFLVFGNAEKNIRLFHHLDKSEHFVRSFVGILQSDDILISANVNDSITEITRQYHIIDMMLDVRAGDIVTLKILRNGEEQTVSITIT
jgi:PDZ domain-containing secreted protein